MKAKKFPLSNISGADEMMSIRNSLSKMSGVKAVRVDNVANTVTVDYDDKRVSIEDLESQLSSISNSFR